MWLISHKCSGQHPFIFAQNRFMKKVLFVLIALASVSAQAQLSRMFGKNPIINMENFQKQPVHWGYYLGFNFYDFKFDYKEPGQDIQVEAPMSFNVGLVGNLRLHEYVDLRLEPGLYYTQRNLTFPGFENPRDRLREVKSTYINVPLLFKFSSLRTGNIRPYVLAGGSAALNLSSNFDAKDDNAERRFRMNKWTYSYDLGFGIDIYTEWFIFSPSIRGSFSVQNELIADNDPNSPWTSNVQSMKTRAVFINFTFH